MKEKSAVTDRHAGENDQRRNAELTCAERLSRILDVPADVACGGMTLELRGSTDLLVCGVRKILAYSDTGFCLATPAGRITVKGDGLSMSAYHNDGTVIRGIVRSIEIDRERGEKGGKRNR